MIGALQRFFDNNPTSSGDAGRLNLAAAALLFEVAQTDDKLDPDERAVIQTLVTAKFGQTAYNRIRSVPPGVGTVM